MNEENSKGYYSGNTNIIQTLVDCVFDTSILISKASKPFFKWLFDGWIDFDKKKEEIDIVDNEKIVNNIDKFFENANLKINNEIPILKDYGEEESYRYYIFKTSIGMCATDFENKKERIAAFFDCDEEDLRFVQYSHNIEMQILKPRDIYIYDPIKMKRDDFKVPLGYDKYNNLVLIDLLSSKYFACYIAGSSGSGKSKTVRLILTHMVNNISPKDLQLVIINTKCVDLNSFKKCKHTILYQKGTEDIVKNMKAQEKEMKRRYDLFDELDYEDIWEARENGYNIPFRLLVIEEISAYQDNKEYQKIIKSIAEMGRAAGIIPICVCQFPNRDVLPSVTKCNFNTIIGHKTINELTSEVIAGKDSGLEKLKGNGHNKIFCSDYQGVEYQSFFVSKKLMKDIVCNKKDNSRINIKQNNSNIGIKHKY